MPPENAPAKERFLQMCKDANLQLRKDEIQEAKSQRLLKRPNGIFISVRNYGLTPEYDLNSQYALMRKCEKDAQPVKAEVEQKEPKIVQQAKKPIKKIGTKIISVEKQVVDMTGKLQQLVAKYTPKTKKNKSKI